MNKGEKSGLVPKLRFPEFRDAEAWESKELHTIAEPVTDRTGNEDENNILTLSGEHGLVLQSEYFGKQIAGTNSDRYLKIRRDDFVYNDRTTKSSEFGTIKRLSKHPHGIVSPIYKCFRLKDGELPKFWEWYFESGAHEAQLRGLANEGARAGRFNVSIDRFLSTRAYAPDSKSNEQQKIAECLASLDALIGFEKERLEALKAFKKGLMQRLFPREGKREPRLRFPEFRESGEWVASTLGERVEVLKGKGISKADIHSNGKLACIRYGELYTRYGEIVSDVASRTNVPVGELFLSKAGDVIVPSSGETKEDIATASCVLDEGVALGGDLNVLRSDLHGPFLSFYLNSAKKSAIAKVAQGDAVVHLYPDQLKALDISAPGIDEQRMISKCLVSLSEQQAVSQKKVEGLILNKQGMMQKLFPSIDLPQ